MQKALSRQTFLDLSGTALANKEDMKHRLTVFFSNTLLLLLMPRFWEDTKQRFFITPSSVKAPLLEDMKQRFRAVSGFQKP